MSIEGKQWQLESVGQSMLSAAARLQSREPTPDGPAGGPAARCAVLLPAARAPSPGSQCQTPRGSLDTRRHLRVDGAATLTRNCSAAGDQAPSRTWVAHHRPARRSPVVQRFGEQLVKVRLANARRAMKRHHQRLSWGRLRAASHGSGTVSKLVHRGERQHAHAQQAARTLFTWSHTASVSCASASSCVCARANTA